VSVALLFDACWRIHRPQRREIVPAVKGHRCLASALSRVGPRILDCRLAAALRTTGKEKHASSCIS
jgi:hypothetical protein